MPLRGKALVSARWLWEALNVRSGSGAGGAGGVGVLPLDASWFPPQLQRDAAGEFGRGHIAGAVHLDLERCCDRTSPLNLMLPSAGEFSERMAGLGVWNGAHVVVYDGSELGAYSAPRVWWMFRVFGHRDVSVLDGGMKSWIQEGFPVTEERQKAEPTEYRASFNRTWVKKYEDILQNMETKQFQVVDARPAGRFKGIEPEPRDNIEPGHIPGSINLPFTLLLAPSGKFLPLDQLRVVFQQAGVDLQRPLCVTCGSALTACHVALAAHLCGQPDVSVYDGGWSEFYTRAEPELVISEGRGKHRCLTGRESLSY